MADSVGATAPVTDGTTPIASATEGLDPTTLLGNLAGQLVELIELGGPVVSVLALLSIFALAIVLLKLWQFFRLGIGRSRPTEKALALWCEQQPEAAIAILAGRRQPVAQLVRLAMTGLSHRTINQSTLREELIRVGSEQLEKLRSYLRALDVIATLSPLLGLLGTVLGMIQAFQQLAIAGSQVDPSILSGGIWQALLTTALGLSVAIPVVLAHTWLERKVERCGHAMEDAVTRVFTRGLAQAAESDFSPTLDHAA